MNTDNNHLIDPELFAKLCSEGKNKDYEEVPNDLTIAAQLELMGKMETTVSKGSTGSINTWAEEKRLAKKLTERQKNKFSLAK